jgi:hypothetical protein
VINPTFETSVSALTMEPSRPRQPFFSVAQAFMPGTEAERKPAFVGVFSARGRGLKKRRRIDERGSAQKTQA